MIDLHLHTTASDGRCDPEDLVERCVAKGISVMAVTDHDTMAGVPEATAAGASLGVRVVPGVELSANDADREVHMLGLHIERASALEDALQTFRDSRYVRAQEIVTKLNADIAKVLAMPDVRNQFEIQGIEILGGTPEQFAGTIREEIAKWAKVIRLSGAKAD